MSHPSARRLALAALREWHKGRRFSDVIIHELLSMHKLMPADRAFAVELFYGVLRNLTLLDFWIDLLRDRKLETESRDLLRLGLYQMLLLQIAEYAAVFETVQLTEGKRRSLINGVLRTAQREKEELLAKVQAEPLSIRSSHPNFLIARWGKNFGHRATAALCEWNNRPAPVYGRINRLKIQPQEFLRAHSASRPLPADPDFVELDTLPIEAVNNGHLYIQDPSTTLACRLLNPQRGETVLDACAAPGGKTALLAQQMENVGAIIACDRDAARVTKLTENLKRLGIKIATTKQCDWTADDASQDIARGMSFDRILLDAPCSNTGAMRRRIDVRWRLRPSDFVRMQNQQLAIARALVPRLKPGGIFVYSTCSLEPEENEEVVDRLAKQFPELDLNEQLLVTPFRNGIDGAFAAKLTRTA